MKTQKSFFEQKGGTYTQVVDVLIPNLNLLAASISSCYNPSLQLGKSRNSCK